MGPQNLNPLDFKLLPVRYHVLAVVFCSAWLALQVPGTDQPNQSQLAITCMFSSARLHDAGCAGLAPTCAAIEAGKEICLANKETLIAGGPFVLPLAAKHNVPLLPADSEHRCAAAQAFPGTSSGAGLPMI